MKLTRQLVIDIACGCGTAGVAVYVFYNAIQRMNQAVAECQGPCVVGPPGLDAWGLLKLVGICVIFAFLVYVLYQNAVTYEKEEHTQEQ
jgi:hypothetical protein